MAASQRQHGIKSPGEPSSPVSPCQHPQRPRGHPVPCDAPSPVPPVGSMPPASLGKEGTTLPKPGAAGLAQPGDGAAAPCSVLVDVGSNTPVWGREEDVSMHAVHPTAKKPPSLALENAGWGNAAARKPAQTFHGGAGGALGPEATRRGGCERPRAPVGATKGDGRSGETLCFLRSLY